MTIDKIEQSVSSNTIYEKDIKYCTYLLRLRQTTVVSPFSNLTLCSDQTKRGRAHNNTTPETQTKRSLLDLGYELWVTARAQLKSAGRQ